MNITKAKILLVDDHQIIIDGISAIIKEHPTYEVIAQANNGKEALEKTAILKPDVVLMDLDMPIMNGTLATQTLKTKHPEIKVIILSLHSEKSVIQHLIQYGADGFLLKHSGGDEILRAIEQVLKGHKYFSSDVTLSLSGLNPKATPYSGDKNEIQKKLSLLTEREIEILKSIAEGFSNKEIAQQIHLSPRTVDAHRANLMKKLDMHKVTALVRFAFKSGLVD